MSTPYDIADLDKWNDRIVELVQRFGLDPFPQEFEMCDHEDMLSYMVYSGMPSHYPHWSYGKGFERLKTMYDYGVSGLPYEMVINSNPSIAYLMRDNSLALQVLTIAHVYGHNDFFKNNFTFQSTRGRIHYRDVQEPRQPRAPLRRGPEHRPGESRSDPRRRSRGFAPVPAQPGDQKDIHRRRTADEDWKRPRRHRIPSARSTGGASAPSWI